MNLVKELDWNFQLMTVNHRGVAWLILSTEANIFLYNSSPFTPIKIYINPSKEGE